MYIAVLYRRHRVMFFYLQLYVLFDLLPNALPEAPPSLELVTLIFRHGDRSPIQAYPTDPHQEDAWPQGYGQLTQKGVKEAHDLGQFLRKKYTGFLNENYDRKEIYIQSTDLDRTLMTAQSVLAGLYPPNDQQRWNSKIPWQPIPIHTMPTTHDSLLLGSCPRLGKEFKEIFSSPYATELNKKYERLSAFLREKSGYSNLTNILSGYVTRIWDTLYCEKENGFQWPEWVNKSTYDIIFYEINPISFGMISKSDLAKRLSGGLFIKKVIDKMHLKVKNLLDPRFKVSMYSGHDSNIASILGALNLFNYKPIPYAVAIMFELHKDKNGTHFVQLWLRNETGQPPHKLKLPGCQIDCPLNSFINLTKKVTPEDWFTECISEEALNHLSPAGVLLLSIVGVVFVLVLLTILVVTLIIKKCATNENKSAISYRELRSETQTMLDDCSSEDEL